MFRRSRSRSRDKRSRSGTPERKAPLNAEGAITIKDEPLDKVNNVRTGIYTEWANKKHGTLLLFISLPFVDRFSKFFHWHTLQTVCNNVIIMHPTTL